MPTIGIGAPGFILTADDDRELDRLLAVAACDELTVARACPPPDAGPHTRSPAVTRADAIRSGASSG
jgi:hypothetical protein